MPVHANQLVVFIIVHVVLPDLVCEERQVKVEAYVLLRRVVKLVVMESVQQTHHVQSDLDGQLGGVLKDIRADILQESQLLDHRLVAHLSAHHRISV